MYGKVYAVVDPNMKISSKYYTRMGDAKKLANRWNSWLVNPTIGKYDAKEFHLVDPASIGDDSALKGLEEWEYKSRVKETTDIPGEIYIEANFEHRTSGKKLILRGVYNEN